LQERGSSAGNQPIHPRVVQDACGDGRYVAETPEVCVRHSGHPFARRGRARLGLACALAAWGCATSLPETPQELGRVEGELRIGRGRESIAKLGPAVVYLERADEPGGSGRDTLDLYDDRAPGLGHDLVVLEPGQSLRFVSRSGVAHRLFAIRGPDRVEVAVPE